VAAAVVDLAAAPRSRTSAVLAGLIAATVVPIVAAVVMAPAGSAPAGSALTLLLFVGSSMHVASTAWFYTVPDVRAHMHRHPARYLWAPLALVVVAAVVAAALTPRALQWLLLAFFAWQFFHFQKQNLGVAALTARARRAAGLSSAERRALVVAGVGGIVGLLGRPDLIALDATPRVDAVFVAGLAVFAGAALFGIACWLRREDRDPVAGGAYLLSLLFFAPVWLFHSPYAAVAGLTIAHGVQYLLLMSLVAAGGTDRTVALLLLVNVAVLIGLALNQMSHQHGAGAPLRALYGVFLGLSMAHFVIDAGLWRLREEFPRTFLSSRLPYLLAEPATSRERCRAPRSDIRTG
jgi:hypothetical protein